MVNKMNLDQAFEKIGHIGRGQQWQLTFYVGTVMYNSWSVCLSIFTQYEHPTANSTASNQSLDATQLYSVHNEFNISPVQLHLITSLFMASIMLGNPVFGALSDRFGRRTVLWIMMFVTSTLTICGAVFCFSWHAYMFWRVLTGFSRSALHICLITLVYEFVGPNYYAMMEFVACLSWAFGLVVLASVAQWLPYWKHLQVFTAIPGFFLGWMIKRSAESPRWLYTNGYTEQAENILKNIGRGNGKTESELDVINLAPLAESKETAQTETPKDLLKSSMGMRRLTSMMLVYFTGSLVYFGITFGTQDLGKDVFTNLRLSSLAEIPGGFIGYKVMNFASMGRKYTLMMFLLSVAIGGYALDWYHLRGTSKIAVVFLCKTLIEGTWAVNNPYSVELFPTSVRTIALGCLSVSSQLAGVAGPFLQDFGKLLVNPDDKDAPFVIYATLAGSSCILVSLCLPETLGTKTHDTIASMEENTSRRGKSWFGRRGRSSGYMKLSTFEEKL